MNYPTLKDGDFPLRPSQSYKLNVTSFLGEKALHNMPQNYIYGLLKLSKTKAALSLHKNDSKKRCLVRGMGTPHAFTSKICCEARSPQKHSVTNRSYAVNAHLES